MNQKRIVNKRKSSVVSTQTYRKMIEKVLEEAPTKALDLHGIYDALASEYDQYRGDSVEVDWRNSIRHCLSINEKFVRVLPDAIRTTFFPKDPGNDFFKREINNEIFYPKTFWTTTGIIIKNMWQPFIMRSASNIRKVEKAGIKLSEVEMISMNMTTGASSSSTSSSTKQSAKRIRRPTLDYFDISPVSHNLEDGKYQPIAKRPSITDILVSEWIDPTQFLDVAPSVSAPSFYSEFPSSATSSPLALDSANQSALFNIAVIDEEDRIVKMREKLTILRQTMPNILGPLKVDFIDIKYEKEPAILPSPLKSSNIIIGNSNNNNSNSPFLVALPPIFNHSI